VLPHRKAFRLLLVRADEGYKCTCGAVFDALGLSLLFIYCPFFLLTLNAKQMAPISLLNDNLSLNTSLSLCGCLIFK